MERTSFASLLDRVAPAAERNPLQLPPDWMQGRAGYGGLVGAMALKSMRSQVPFARKVRSLLIGFALFIRDNWNLLWPILKDPEVSKIVRKNFSVKIKPHVDLLKETLKECRKKGYLAPGSDSHFLFELMNGAVAPIIMYLLAFEITPDMMKEGNFAGEKNSLETDEIYRHIDTALTQILKPKSRTAR